MVYQTSSSFFLPSKDMIDHDDDNGDGDDGVANFNANAEADQRSDADSKTFGSPCVLPRNISW